MRKQISPERKGLYYLGLALTVIGILTFVSGMFVSHLAIHIPIWRGL